jgi:hypothetical protein
MIGSGGFRSQMTATEFIMRYAFPVLMAMVCGWNLFANTADEAADENNGSATGVQDPKDAPPLHSEKGLHGTLVVESHGRFHRLVINDTLWGLQFNDKFERHWMDDFCRVVPGSPWDMVAAFGVNATFNPRLDPLSYYHRTGPVGAIFRELQTRKNGADAVAPVGIVSLGAGSESAYAVRGQSFTYYESDPALKRLVADSDRYFTFIADARKRGALIEIRIGNPRKSLAEDKGRKYPLLIVDLAAESYPIPRDTMTMEAVQLYFDRMTGDGILGLHVSNRYINLEPMIDRMAKELKLEARIWNDPGENRPGKTASSWIVLARSEKALGKLATPLEHQRTDFGSQFEPLKSSPGIRVWTDKQQDVWSLAFKKDSVELRRLLERKP